MSDQRRPWYEEWFEPSGYLTHRAEGLRAAGDCTIRCGDAHN